MTSKKDGGCIVAKDLIVGLSAMFLIWGSAIVWASSRLVWRNIDIYRNWLTVDRDTRVKMALWLAVPLLMVAIIGQRTRAFYALATDRWVADFGALAGIAFLMLAVTAMSLALFWACDRTWGPAEGDRVWCRIMWLGLATGAATSVLSWWF